MRARRPHDSRRDAGATFSEACSSEVKTRRGTDEEGQCKESGEEERRVEKPEASGSGGASRHDREHRGGQALNITAALAEEAKKGELAPAKFLFEMIGLYPMSAGSVDEEAEDAEDGNEFAKALLKHLALPGSGEDAEEATGFAGVTRTGNSVE